MSVHISSAVWKLPLDATDKLILLRFADCADHDGNNAWPSVATLAKDCGVSESTVQRSLRSLRAAGYLVVQRESGVRRPTTYRVVPYRAEEGVNVTPIARVSSDGLGVSSGTSEGVTHDTRSVPNRPNDPSTTAATRARARKKPKASMSLDEKSARDAVEELTGTLTSSVSAEIHAECEKKPGRGNWIVRAVAEAASANVRNWAYVKAVLKRYDSEGLGAPRREGTSGRRGSTNGRDAAAYSEKQRAALARGGEW